MADTNQHSKNLKFIEDLLSDDNPHRLPIPPDLANELLRKGAILALRDAATPEAIAVLGKLSYASPDVDIRNLSLLALNQLAASGSIPAIDAIYTLALKDHQAAARQMIITSNWQPSKPAIKAIFDWLTAVDNGKDPVVDLSQLTDGFFYEADPSLQAAIVSRAGPTRFHNWAQLVSILNSSEGDFHPLVHLYPNLSQAEQNICLIYLEKLADIHPPAQAVLCNLFIEHDDRAARDIALKHGYLPEQPYEQALFYFLIGDQERYQQVDFLHNLLVTAYESGSRGLRRRLLSFSRQTGQIEWLSAINQSNTIRWLADLSDSDWDLAVHKLLDQARFVELWRLAQVAPPVWSAGILVRLKKAQWKPDSKIDRENFEHLANLAGNCFQDNLECKPFTKLMALSDNILSMAFHPSTTLLAAGSSGQPIFLWQLPEGEMRFPSLIGPAASTRAVKFSLDGELVIAASGDQRIRLFRHKNGQIIKTLEGHRGLIRSMALHPNGRLLVTCSFDGAIRFWRFPLGTLVKTVFSPVREIFAAEILAKGDLLATGGAGDQVNIWNLPDGNLLRTIPVDQNGILHLAANPLSDLLAVADRSKMITIWNAVNGNLVQQLPRQEEAIAGLQIHPDEQILITASAKGLIKLWNIHSGSVLMTFAAPQANIITTALSSDGQTLACADHSGAIHLWNLSSFIWLHTPHQAGVTLPLDPLSKRLLDPQLPTVEKKWLLFTESLWKWIRRYEIEISEPMMIELGEFDIEL